MNKGLLTWAFFLLITKTGAQDFSAYTKEYFQYNNTGMSYRFLSPAVEKGSKYPLVIFLHGAFEKGTDNETQLHIGGDFFLRDSIRKNYPAFVLFPQCPSGDAWAYFENRLDFSTGLYTDWDFPFRKTPTNITRVLLKLIDSVARGNDKIDSARIYIAGVSQGGMGVLDIIARKPARFAAALSICGAGEPATAHLFAGKVGLWLFHGEQDIIIPIDFSQQFYRKLKRWGSNVRFSAYAGVEHNSWVKAFEEPELLKWLFTQSKP